ncbi:hypothetical protein ACFSQ7_33310 [Paenibacillus rhizoplanae]
MEAKKSEKGAKRAVDDYDKVSSLFCCQQLLASDVDRIGDFFELIHGVMERRVSVGLFVSLIGASGSILGIADDLSLLFSRLSHRCMEIMHYEKVHAASRAIQYRFIRTFCGARLYSSSIH